MDFMRSNFKFYDSIYDFTHSDTKTVYQYDLPNNWQGGRRMAASKQFLMNGAGEDVMRKARALLDKIDTHIHGVEGEVWTPEVYGAYPIVPDYLAGDPLCMRTKAWRESDMAPIRVVLNTLVSAGVNHSTMERRATACAAFVMKLSERRPVELWMAGAIYHEVQGRDVGYRVKLDMPMNLSQVLASYDPSVCRQLAINELENLATGNTGECTNFSGVFQLKGAELDSNRARYMKAFREYMQLGKDDLVVDAGFLTDSGDIDANQVEWVRTMLMKYGFEAEDQV